MKILVLNAGSSSLRFELFDSRARGRGSGTRGTRGSGNENLESLFKGHIDNRGKPIKDFGKVVGDAVSILMQKKLISDHAEISAVGHRVVHGGEHYTKSALVTPRVIATIRKLSRLAPLHNPSNLEVIVASKKLFPKVRQVAVFDTAFHQTMPERAFLYGLPYSFYKKFGIRRYGFHGTSHQYVYEQARKKLGARATRRTITCHLGNGCSIAAILNGKVVDTSMGFTPLEGVPMGTRSGDIDPSIIFYLIGRGMSPQKIEEMLNKESGLRGVSGFSGDVRDLWAGYRKGDKRAVRTLEFFAYRIAKYIGAYSASLRGVDCIVFTGGIGENAAYLRKWIMHYIIGFPRNRVLVIPADEERKIAEETLKQM